MPLAEWLRCFVLSGRIFLHNNDQSNPLLRQLLSLFPYEPARPVQRAALEIIARMFHDGNHFSIIEAPTGSGKSALAFTTARIGATLDDGEFSSGAYILMPHNNLAEQMTSDFGNLGLASLKASKHYDSVSPGNCRNDICTYEQAKARFCECPLGVTNYSYFLRARRLPQRPVLILDEGHNLERSLLELEGFSVTSQTCRAAGVDAPRLFGPHEQEETASWLGTVLLPAMRKRSGRYAESPAQREWEDLAERVARFIDMEDRSQWLAWSEEGVLSAKPLSVVTPARELFARARHVVIQSATILDFATFQRILGIPDDALTFCAPSDFPLRNRPIIYTPCGFPWPAAARMGLCENLGGIDHVRREARIVFAQLLFGHALLEQCCDMIHQQPGSSECRCAALDFRIFDDQFHGFSVAAHSILDLGDG